MVCQTKNVSEYWGDEIESMEKSQWYMGTPNGVILCMDHMEGFLFQGRLYQAYSSDATEFKNMDEALFQLEQFYNDLNFPHPTTTERTFSEKKQGANSGKERQKVMSDEELLSKHGDLGTFIIRVQHRQNSSWQGRITWMEKNKTLYFRSIWEMIKLVASALDTVSTQEDTPEEVSWTDEE